MNASIEEQIAQKRTPALIALVAKLETQAFAAELEAAELRRKAEAARAELRRLTGEAEPAVAPAPAPLPVPPPGPPPGPPPAGPRDLPDELTTCPDPDLHLPRPPVLSDLARAVAHPFGAAGAPAAPDLPGRPSGPLVEAGRRGYASGHEEALAWVADQLELEVGTDEVDEVRAAIEGRIHDLRKPRPAAPAVREARADIADHVVPPALVGPGYDCPDPDCATSQEARPAEPLETIAERCGGCGAQATGTDAAGSAWCDPCWSLPARNRGGVAPVGRREPAPRRTAERGRRAGRS